MKDLRKTLISILIVAAGLFVVDLAVGFAGERMVAMQPDYGGQFAKDNLRLNRMVGDIVFIGSSRTSHHMAIPVLQDSIGPEHELYNAGIDGRFLNNSCCAIECILQRGTPNLIVLEANDGSFRNSATESIDRSITFYRSCPTLKQYIDNLGFEYRIYSQINMYRFNSTLARLVKNILRPEAKNDGYEPLKNVMKVIPEKKDKPQDTTYNLYTEANFRRVLALCRDRGVNLVVASSPQFGFEGTNPHTAALCAEYGIPYIDMMSIPYFNQHPELFQDAGHLNDPGARLFSSMFYPKLKPYIP